MPARHLPPPVPPAQVSGCSSPLHRTRAPSGRRPLAAPTSVTDRPPDPRGHRAQGAPATWRQRPRPAEGGGRPSPHQRRDAGRPVPIIAAPTHGSGPSSASPVPVLQAMSSGGPSEPPERSAACVAAALVVARSSPLPTVRWADLKMQGLAQVPAATRRYGTGHSPVGWLAEGSVRSPTPEQGPAPPPFLRGRGEAT
jgi:hypothetical protein